MRKKAAILAVMLVLAGACLSVAALAEEQKGLCEKLIRLHVVANSDDAYDQAVKLKVRDAVLMRANELLQEADDPEAVLTENLQVLADTAQGELRKRNDTADIRVSYQYERFPTRQYDTFSLPAGVYKTLRVTIGRGEGHNWWCVVYPSLCLAASADALEEAAETADFSAGQVRLISGADAPYRFRFKSLEILDRLKAALFS